MSSVNERQVAGTHYKSTYQHWDFVQKQGLSYLPAQVTKYLVRWRKKNGVQDLEKALHFLEKFISEERDRRETLRKDLANFLTDNVVPSEESEIIHNIVAYNYRLPLCIVEAHAKLKLLIERQKTGV